MSVSDVDITAGLGGFLTLFGLGLVVWFLGRDLSRRLRRMRQAESLRATRAEQPGAAPRGEDDGRAAPRHVEPDDGGPTQDGPLSPPRE